jgi:acetyl-CoA synthetase
MADRFTRWPTIHKGPWPGDVVPNVLDLDAARSTFSWAEAAAGMSGLPGGAGLNIAHEAVDRHADGPRAEVAALRWIHRDGTAEELTYRALRRRTNRFANVLRSLGVGRGDTVYTLLGRVPDVHVVALGTLKNTSVFCPLFSVFGPEPVRVRLERGGAKVLVTNAELYRRKVEPVRSRLPDLAHVLLVGPHAEGVEGTVALEPLLDAASDDFEIPPTSPDDLALLHFTSGTTGAPKAAMHVHEAVVAHFATAASALDLHPDDVFWCTADPGWVTGTSYGIIAPLVHGVTTIVDEAPFDTARWYRILHEQQVSVLYTSPTALRMLNRSELHPVPPEHLRHLRFVASVGEPLEPQLVAWGIETLGLPVHDNWWQTETGGIMIANLAGAEIHPGSMGRPLPGVEAAILRCGPDGRAAVVDGTVQPVARPTEEGELALRAGWPSMFRGYLDEPERYQACFVDGWYLTGDLARRDAEGWFWFVGRADDVIESSGHLIGPFEVESVLLEHPAVAEVGVIGLPDPLAGELVTAIISLRPGFEPDDELRSDLLAHARRQLGPAVAPRRIKFDHDLPRTESGKVIRRLLRERELSHAAPVAGGPR